VKIFEAFSADGAYLGTVYARPDEAMKLAREFWPGRAHSVREKK
jgi:hypothetical protein